MSSVKITEFFPFPTFSLLFRLFFICFSLVDETIVHSVGWSFVNTKTGKRNVQLVDGNG